MSWEGDVTLARAQAEPELQLEEEAEELFEPMTLDHVW